jgi:hypothetical protein
MLVRGRLHCLELIQIFISTDEEVVAKLAELDIVVMDLERANARVVEAQSKNVSASQHQLRSFD